MPDAEPALAAHWLLNETTGVVAHDISGHGNHGTVFGNAAWTADAGHAGIKLSPQAEVEYVEIPDAPVFQHILTENYTVCAWFKPLSTPAESALQNRGAYTILSRSDGGWVLRYTKEQCFLLNTAREEIKSLPLSPGVFYHITCVRTSGLAQLYINGALADTRPVRGPNRPEPNAQTPHVWRIGCRDAGSSPMHWAAHGVVSDVRIYDRALSETEIRLLSGNSVGTDEKSKEEF